MCKLMLQKKSGLKLSIDPGKNPKLIYLFIPESRVLLLQWYICQTLIRESMFGNLDNQKSDYSRKKIFSEPIGSESCDS